MDPLRVVTFTERPDLRDAVSRLHGEAWPPFQSKGAVVQRYWNALYTDFPEFQFALLNDEAGPVAAGNAIPLRWDGQVTTLPEGWDDAVECAFAPHAGAGDTLCALAAVTRSDYQRAGLSACVIEEMKNVATRHGFRRLIAPVRPTWKARYPLTPIGRYATWRRPDGTAFDPWLRVHLRLRGVILRTAPRSTVIEGAVAQWEEWTAMSFPGSGSYVVPGALSPIQIDTDADRGVYVEPNIWVLHQLSNEATGTAGYRAVLPNAPAVVRKG